MTHQLGDITFANFYQAAQCAQTVPEYGAPHEIRVWQRMDYLWGIHMAQMQLQHARAKKRVVMISVNGAERLDPEWERDYRQTCDDASYREGY